MSLITGGMGLIGLHTARRFLDAGEDTDWGARHGTLGDAHTSHAC